MLSMKHHITPYIRIVMYITIYVGDDHAPCRSGTDVRLVISLQGKIYAKV